MRASAWQHKPQCTGHQCICWDAEDPDPICDCGAPSYACRCPWLPTPVQVELVETLWNHIFLALAKNVFVCEVDPRRTDRELLDTEPCSLDAIAGAERASVIASDEAELLRDWRRRGYRDRYDRYLHQWDETAKLCVEYNRRMYSGSEGALDGRKTKEMVVVPELQPRVSVTVNHSLGAAPDHVNVVHESSGVDPVVAVGVEISRVTATSMTVIWRPTMKGAGPIRGLRILCERWSRDVGCALGQVVRPHRHFCVGDVVIIDFDNGGGVRQPVWCYTSKGKRMAMLDRSDGSNIRMCWRASRQ